MATKRGRIAERVGKPTKKQVAHPFGSPVIWDRTGRILEVSASRTFGSLLRMIRGADADWVVVVRSLQHGIEVFYYAFRVSEIEEFAASFPNREEKPIEQAMHMHEGMSSAPA